MLNAYKKTILISEPNQLGVTLPYIPYIWAILKSSFEHLGNFNDRCEWLEPIYLNADVSSLLRPYQHVAIDVLGLSCYTWNWKRFFPHGKW